MRNRAFRRRTVLKTTGAVAVGAGVTVQSATAQPAEGQTVFVGGAGIHAVDAATGEERWHFDTGVAIASSPTVVNGTVFVGGTGIHAIDAATGEERWRFETDDHVGSSPTVVDSTVFLGGSDDKLYAVDAATGEQQWRFNAGDCVESSPTVVDDPTAGDSIDSRVRLGTLGHHRVAASD